MELRILKRADGKEVLQKSDLIRVEGDGSRYYGWEDIPVVEEEIINYVPGVFVEAVGCGESKLGYKRSVFSAKVKHEVGVGNWEVGDIVCFDEDPALKLVVVDSHEANTNVFSLKEGKKSMQYGFRMYDRGMHAYFELSMLRYLGMRKVINKQ